MKTLKRIGINLLALYLILFVVALFLGERLAFFPPEASYWMTERGYQMTIAPDGTPIALRWLPTQGARYVVLYAGGNAEDTGNQLPVLQDFRRLGFSVLAFDYEGYGHSGGKAGEKGLRNAAQAAWNFLTKEQGIAPENIAVVGFSMGGAAACYLGANERPRAVLLFGAFASAFHAALPFNPFPWTLLDNRKFAEKFQCPVLIFHGTSDPVVPYRNAEMLYRHIASPKRLVGVPGADHYGVILSTDPVLWRGIGQFVNHPEEISRIDFGASAK